MKTPRGIASSPYIVGPPIQDPKRFIGRTSLVQRFFNNLRENSPQSLWVRGIRRSGKSSFLRHVADPLVIEKHLSNLPNRHRIAYVDLLDDIRTTSDFYNVVARALFSVKPNGPLPKLESFSQFKSFIAGLDDHRFPVILLDELDTLANRPQFDSEFWLSLRSLAQDQVVWVTASCLHIKDFTRKPGEITSPFFNVFSIAPLIVGLLEEEEVTALVVPPARNRGVSFAPEEVRGIQKLAGKLPYLLQVTAEAWFFARIAGVAPEDCFDAVMSSLLDPRTLMSDIFGSHWRHLTVREQQSLKCAALHKAVTQTRENRDAQKMLVDFGLLFKGESGLQPSGELLRNWLVSETEKNGQLGLFIGHGHHHIWRAVRDFFKALDVRVVCYDAEPHVGQSIANILEDMLNQSEYAVIVLTAEDTMASGGKRARQNVVHEAGYCQGRLGFENVVLLREKGLEGLSNLDGIQYIDFEGDKIEDTFPALFRFFRDRGLTFLL